GRPDRRGDRARARSGRIAVHVPAADGRRLRWEIRSAQRLQHLRRRSRILRPRSCPLSAGDGGVGAGGRRPTSPAGPARHAEYGPARPPRAGRPRFGRGGCLVTAPAVPIDRSRLPEPGRGRPFFFPAIEKSQLPNGLRVWTVGHASVPVVTCMLLIKRGSASDPPGKEGLAAISVDMLDEGSGGRSAIEMHEALARIGAQFDSDIGSDGAALTVTLLSRFVERGLT